MSTESDNTFQYKSILLNSDVSDVTELSLGTGAGALPRQCPAEVTSVPMKYSHCLARATDLPELSYVAVRGEEKEM